MNSRPYGENTLLGRVALLSDHPQASEVWSSILSQQGLEVSVHSLDDMATEPGGHIFADLVMIDLNRLCTAPVDCVRLTLEHCRCPVVLFLVGPSEQTAIEALWAGADDCISKPASPLYVIAKVRAWLRRMPYSDAIHDDALTSGEFTVDAMRRQLTRRDGKVVNLTSLEFRVLYLLMSEAGRVCTTQRIMQRVWGYVEADPLLLKNVIYRLRQKLEYTPHRPHFLLSVPGEGYFFNPSPEDGVPASTDWARAVKSQE